MGDFIPELKQTIQQSIDDPNPPTNSKEITTENPLDMAFFKPTTYPFHNCLVVNWDKKEGAKSKWYGNFRWFWGFTHGDQGFIVFSSLETSPSEPKLQVSGGVYLIQNGVNGKNN